MATIQTQLPSKGDLVPGHDVYAFMPRDLPAIRGRIVAASDSGHRVTLEIDAGLAIFGLPRRTEWTWRRSVGAYQEKNSRTSKGWGLALIRT